MMMKVLGGAVCALSCWALVGAEYSADVVIYGSTPAALSAAVQTTRMGKRAVIVTADRRIGGLTTGGLGQTDIGSKAAFGGIAVEFYRDVATWYADERHWTHQKSGDYFPDGQCAGSRDGGTMWTFEPSAALAILEGWIKRDGLEVHRGECLDRSASGVVRQNGRIVAFRTLAGNVYRGKMFVDATYEGDLLAAAGVSYTLGRESNATYGETINGNAPAAPGSAHHNFSPWVSAYVKPGDRSSGLLPGVEPYDSAAKPGDGDRRVQAYCFRMCLTDVPANRIPFVKPKNYDERNYELLFREYEAIAAHPEYTNAPPGCLDAKSSRIPFIMSRMPNGKTDSNNRCGFSSDFIGRNWHWAEAQPDERVKILLAHLDYQRGLMWTLANHPRIPEDVRAYFSKFGMCKDEFQDGLGDGWQKQLYVREGRRMVGDYVMTEHNCRGTVKAERPVAMAAYGMDSHHVRRVETKDGCVRNEGNVEDHSHPGPYPIDYGALVPKKGECANLLVPVCLSASHIAYGSIRMEPVFFALGQVAGTAAAQAIDAGVSVQDLPYAPLAARLRADGQVLGPKESAKTSWMGASLGCCGASIPERQELLPLPAGAITARGWIKTMLERSREGMGGHYGEFDPNQFELPGLTKDYDARLPGAGWRDIPGWCAEMSGEYRLGQFELAETLGDAGLQAKFRAWRDALLAGQEADGYLGAYRPKDNRLEDYNAWGAHFYYRALLLEYSRTRDPRLLDALHRGLLWFVNAWSGDKKTTYAGPTIIWPMIEVYKLTGDARLLAFCEDYAKFLDKHAEWNSHRAGWINATGGFAHLSLELGAYHVVAYAVRAQLAGILSLATGDGNLLKASIASFEDHYSNVGWQATYAPVSDMEHTSYPSCIGETEYCNFLCWMEYLQWLARLTGEAKYGDLIERMAFNAAMGARRKDERAIAYNTSPNQFRATKTSARAGCCKYYEVYCPCEFAACCTAQSIRLLPSYLMKSVMRTRGGDLAIATYGPCHVEDGGVSIDMETSYPFEETVRLHVTAKDGWMGALRLRRPVWATDCVVTRNGAACAVAAKDGWLALEGPWSRDKVVLTFGRRPVVRAVRERGMDEPLRAVEWGPLVFAQPLKETWTPVKDDPKSRPLPPEWPWYDVTCAEPPTLYALPVKTAFDPSSIRVKRVATDAYPWETPPVRLVVPMVRAPQAYAAEPERQEKNTAPVANPVAVGRDAVLEDVELVPFGATCLRLACFPLAN